MTQGKFFHVLDVGGLTRFNAWSYDTFVHFSFYPHEIMPDKLRELFPNVPGIWVTSVSPGNIWGTPDIEEMFQFIRDAVAKNPKQAFDIETWVSSKRGSNSDFMLERPGDAPKKKGGGKPLVDSKTISDLMDLI